ncbi:unnamed protein product, partial [Rangifer tarandus platyrhynchus]
MQWSQLGLLMPPAPPAAGALPASPLPSPSLVRGRGLPIHHPGLVNTVPQSLNQRDTEPSPSLPACAMGSASPRVLPPAHLPWMLSWPRLFLLRQGLSAQVSVSTTAIDVMTASPHSDTSLLKFIKAIISTDSCDNTRSKVNAGCDPCGSVLLRAGLEHQQAGRRSWLLFFLDCGFPSEAHGPLSRSTESPRTGSGLGEAGVPGARRLGAQRRSIMRWAYLR